MLENGKKYKFNTTDTRLMQYNETEVEVIRPLTETECDIADVGNMYKVRFPDGNENDVFEDELSEQDNCRIGIYDCSTCRNNGDCIRQD